MFSGPALDTALALTVTAVGVVTTSVGTVLAQATAPEIAPYVSGGGAVAAVGGLVYVAKKLASGELVALAVADLVRRASTREDKLVELMRDAQERESAYRSFFMAQGRRDE